MKINRAQAVVLLKCMEGPDFEMTGEEEDTAELLKDMGLIQISVDEDGDAFLTNDDGVAVLQEYIRKSHGG